jgi:hypothetical protein
MLAEVLCLMQLVKYSVPMSHGRTPGLRESLSTEEAGRPFYPEILCMGMSKGSRHELYSSLKFNYTTVYQRLIRTQQEYLGNVPSTPNLEIGFVFFLGLRCLSFFDLSGGVGK